MRLFPPTIDSLPSLPHAFCIMSPCKQWEPVASVTWSTSSAGEVVIVLIWVPHARLDSHVSGIVWVCVCVQSLYGFGSGGTPMFCQTRELQSCRCCACVFACMPECVLVCVYRSSFGSTVSLWAENGCVYQGFLSPLLLVSLLKHPLLFSLLQPWWRET